MGRKALKIPKTIKNNEFSKESRQDKLEVAYAVAKATNTKFVLKEGQYMEHKDADKDLKIKEDANELMVITKMKKLTSYVILVTEQSPKRFRVIFVNRMQNMCLDSLQFLFEANSIRLDSKANVAMRRDFQRKAFAYLKMVSYIAYLAYESKCILGKHLREISQYASETINLLVAWRKSDAIKSGVK